MSLNINYCRLCLQKIIEPVKTLSKDSKILTLVTNLFPGMATSLVINSKLCNECLKCVEFSNSVIESVKENELKILLNLQNISIKNSCRLCLSNEKLEPAVCLLKNTNEEARHIIEMAITDLDFDIFRKPIVCNNCWTKVKYIYLFKKKCFLTEKILKYYCATNKINSLDRKELEMVSFSYQEKVQQFSENLDKQTFLCEKNAGSICTLNNCSNNEHDIFEEVSEVDNHQPKEEDKIDIVEEKLRRFSESDEIVDMAADAVKLESIDTIEQTEIALNAFAIPLNKTENVENNCHFIKSPSQPRIDIKKGNNGYDNVLKFFSKNGKLMTQLSIKLEKLLFCDKCDYWTKNKSQLHRHCSRHDNNAEQNHIRNHESQAKTLLSLECEEGSYKTGEKVNITTTCSNSVNNHMETRQTKPEQFKCQKCDYVTKRRTSLKIHMLIHQDNYNFHCYNCSYKAKRKDQLVRHMLIHQENYFSCDKCNYQSRTKSYLVTHNMLVHQDNYNFQCHKCNYQAKSKPRLKHHMLVHQDIRNFPCDTCSYRAKTKVYLAAHMLVHQDNHNFQCHKCSYQAKKKPQLVAHMLDHKDNCNFQCHKCNYQGKSKLHLNRHMLVHQDNHNFQCDKCSYRAKRKRQLVAHMLVHQDNCNFQCHKCNYQGKSKPRLNRHMLVHQDNHNFQCHNCSYQTKRKFDLVSHMLIHQENYNFSCDKCNYQAKRKKYLLTHMLRHQNGKKFVRKPKKMYNPILQAPRS